MVLHEYYSSTERHDGSEVPTKKIEKRFYNINDPKDTPLIMSCESQSETYGMIIVAGGRHRTPVIVIGNDVVILESLGTSKSKVGVNSVAQIALAMSRVPGKSYNIYTPAGNRQVDSVSCGTDSFLALKEGLRLGDGLFESITSQPQRDLNMSITNVIDVKEKADSFYDNGNISVKQFDSLPPEIAKYSQSMSSIKGLSIKDEEIIVNSTKRDKEHETVAEYAKRNAAVSVVDDKGKPSKDVGIEIFGSQEVVRLKGTKETITNSAIEKRRAKHKTITKNMTSTLTSTKVDDIIRESSGINLILANSDKLPASLFHAADTENANIPLSRRIDEYIADQKHIQRDDKLSIAPSGRHSLH